MSNKNHPSKRLSPSSCFITFNLGTAYISGSLLSLTWSIMAFLLVLSYSCNLRAHLIAPSFEKPIDGMEDILERGATLYVPSYYKLSR